MPSRTKQKNAEIAARSAALPKIPKELMDQLVAGPMTGEQVNAATLAFKKALIERVMGAELGHHLGQGEAEAGNHRNGSSAKTVITEGPVRVDIPRDRNGSFEPILIPMSRVAEFSPVVVVQISPPGLVELSS
jgi:transposase-like protein